MLIFIFIVMMALYTTDAFSMNKKVLTVETYVTTKQIINFLKQNALSAENGYLFIKKLIVTTAYNNKITKHELKKILNTLYINIGSQHVDALSANKKKCLQKGIDLINKERKKQILQASSINDMHIAVLHDHQRIFELLFETLEPEIMSKIGKELLHASIIKSNIAMVQNVLKKNFLYSKNNIFDYKSKTDKNSFWHLAAILKDSEKAVSILKLLTHHYEMQYKTKLNWTIPNQDHATPVHIVCSWYCREISTTTLKFILAQYGVNINSQDDTGKTPLHLASIWDCKDSIQELLENKADYTITDKMGNTPLHLVCLHCNPNSAELLLSQKKIVIDAYNKNKQTPLLLLLTPCERSSQDIEKTLVILDLLLKNGADASLQDSNNNTPLHYLLQTPSKTESAFKFILRSAWKLLEYRASCKIKNKKGLTPLSLSELLCKQTSEKIYFMLYHLFSLQDIALHSVSKTFFEIIH